MNLTEARAAIYTRFITQWGTRTPYLLEGRDSKEPGVEVAWVRLSVREVDGGQSTLGNIANRKYERTLAVIAQVFTPATDGMKSNDEHAETFRTIFEGVRLDPQLWLYDATVTNVPLGRDEKSRQTNVQVLGTYEEIK